MEFDGSHRQATLEVGHCVMGSGPSACALSVPSVIDGRFV